MISNLVSKSKFKLMFSVHTFHGALEKMDVVVPDPYDTGMKRLRQKVFCNLKIHWNQYLLSKLYTRHNSKTTIQLPLIRVFNILKTKLCMRNWWYICTNNKRMNGNSFVFNLGDIHVNTWSLISIIWSYFGCSIQLLVMALSCISWKSMNTNLKILSEIK